MVVLPQGQGEMDESVTTKTARRGCGLGGDPRGITERTWVPVIKLVSHSRGRAQPLQHQVAVPKHCHYDTPSHFPVLLAAPASMEEGPTLSIIAFPFQHPRDRPSLSW